MKVILPRRSDLERSITVTIHPVRALLGIIYILLVGIGLTTLFTGASNDLLLSGFVVGIALLITTLIIYCYPHVFDIFAFRLPGMFVLSYSLLILIPLPFIYRDYAYASRNDFLFATLTSYILTLSGIIFVHYCFPSPPGDTQRWLSTPIRITSVLKLSSIVLLSLCFGILVLYVRQVGSLPLFEAIKGGRTALELALAREAALKLIPGRIVYVYTLNRNVLFPYTTLLLFVLAITCRGWGWRVLFGVSLFGSMLVAAATLEKTPVTALVMMLAFGWLMTRGKKLSLTKMLPIVIVAFIFPVFVYLAAYQFSADIERVIRGITRRILYLPDEVLYHYFSYFPDRHGFLMGRTLPYISKIFIDGPFPILNTICLYMRPDNPITSCFANAAFPGFLWADFGWTGIIVGSFLTGMMLQILQILTLRLPKSASTIALQAMLAYFVTILSYTALTDLLDPAGRGFAIVLTLLLSLASTPKSSLA